MSTNRAYLLVSFELPAGVDLSAARSYTDEAVRSWAGSLQPPGADNGDGTKAAGDPMFELDPETVSVTVQDPRRAR